MTDHLYKSQAVCVNFLFSMMLIHKSHILVATDANVKILSWLGRGGFGVVHRVEYEGKEVALKVTQVSYDPDIKEVCTLISLCRIEY